MANCLVTGGAGFIGSHIVKHLLNRGHHVIVVDDFSGGFKENIPPNVEIISANIIDNIEPIFSKKIDYVYHLAAYAAEGLSHFIRKFNYQNNLIGSINLINASIKYNVKCFVFTSSIAVYGNNVCPMCETHQPNPEDPYGIAKLAVEQDLMTANKMFGLNYVIFRPHNVYGEHQNIGDKYRNVIGIFMNQILKNEPITVFGDGQQIRAFSYIDDIAPYIADSAFNEKCYSNIFNIGGDTPYTVNYLLNEITRIFNVKPKILYLPERKEVHKAFANHEKIKQFFNSTDTDLQTGLTKMANWVKIHGARQTKKFENIEIEKNLPQSWLE